MNTEERRAKTLSMWQRELKDFRVITKQVAYELHKLSKTETTAYKYNQKRRFFLSIYA